MPTIVPNQKILDIALFIQYFQQLKKMPRTANSLFSRVKSVYEKLKTLNNAEIASPQYSLPLEEKELYLQRCEGMLNGDVVTREWGGSTHLYIRNGVNEIDVVQELIATDPTFIPYDPTDPTFRPYDQTMYYRNAFVHPAFVHPDGVVVRLISYAKGLLILLDSDLVLDSVIGTSRNQFVNTVAVMSIEGDSMWCINLDTSKNTNVFSTMEFNTTNKTTKHYDDIRWTYDTKNYRLANGFLYQDAVKFYVGFDPTEICNRKALDQSGYYLAKRKSYIGYPFQLGFDGSYLYWNATKIVKPTGYYTVTPPPLLDYQYVKRFKVVA